MPFKLPDGRTLEIEAQRGDLSISGALAHTGGAWEPHVQQFLRRTVKPNWICMDVGANFGLHTLGLASLATGGKVFAFEADPGNFAILSRNTAATPRPFGAIEALHLALSDRSGTLFITGAAELAGCFFVTEGGAEETERRLRDVVSSDAIAAVDLAIHHNEVAAARLDDWASPVRFTRLDFIKLDVEGAEASVIRGATTTLRRFRPILLVEYNPACAAAYFGQVPDALFRELEDRYSKIHALEDDGSLSDPLDWDQLKARLAAGRGWEDLVCLPY